MAVAATALAVGAVALDRRLAETRLEGAWVYAGGAEGAREVLSVIAGSMITVAGVVFSITIVALTLAVSQFGTRLLRNFMRDTTCQNGALRGAWGLSPHRGLPRAAPPSIGVF